MKFKITYTVGKSIREKIIISDNLDDAEKKVNEQKLKWTDIIIINKGKKF